MPEPQHPYDAGDILPPGPRRVRNDTGEPEPVAAPPQ